MPLYLLDTDHMSLLYTGTTIGKRIAERLHSLPKDDFGTSVISFEEQTRGWLSEIAEQKTEQNATRVYDRLLAILNLYRSFAVWEYTDAATDYFYTLRKGGVRIGTPDLRIASIALANDAVVLTRNRKDFTKVPGLIIEDWTADVS